MKRKYCDRINHRHFKNFDFVPFEKFFFKLLQSLGVNWDVRCARAEGKGHRDCKYYHIFTHFASGPASPPLGRPPKRRRGGRAAAHGTRPQLVGRAPFRTLSTPQLAVHVGTQAPNRTKQGTRNKRRNRCDSWSPRAVRGGLA